MDFERLLQLVGDEPVFETALLLAGNINPDAVRLQLTRWTHNGRIFQLRRGLYALAPPYQKTPPHPFLIANRLQPASYVSGASALAYDGLIPDVVHVTISMTTGRPQRRLTPLGVFDYRRIQPRLLRGYRQVELSPAGQPEQPAFVAKPEKALLDLVYLTPGGDRPEFLDSLRLQNLHLVNLDELRSQAEAFDLPKLRRAAAVIARQAAAEVQEYKPL